MARRFPAAERRSRKVDELTVELVAEPPELELLEPRVEHTQREARPLGDVRAARRPERGEVVRRADEVERRAHERRLHDASPRDCGYELLGLEPVEARPQTQIRRRRPLRLEARDALDSLPDRQPVPPKQELSRERRPIQLAEGERPHDATMVGAPLAGIFVNAANRDCPMRILLVVLLLAFAGLLAVDLESAATSRAAVAAPARVTAPKPAPRTVDVAFVRDGWVVRVQRVVPKGGSAPEVALRELTQGPTRAERRSGIRTALPERARLALAAL